MSKSATPTRIENKTEKERVCVSTWNAEAGMPEVQFKPTSHHSC